MITFSERHYLSLGQLKQTPGLKAFSPRYSGVYILIVFKRKVEAWVSSDFLGLCDSLEATGQRCGRIGKNFSTKFYLNLFLPLIFQPLVNTQSTRSSFLCFTSSLFPNPALPLHSGTNTQWCHSKNAFFISLQGTDTCHINAATHVAL